MTGGIRIGDIKEQQKGDFHLEHGNLELAGNIMGRFVIVWQEHGGCISAGDFAHM